MGTGTQMQKNLTHSTCLSRFCSKPLLSIHRNKPHHIVHQANTTYTKPSPAHCSSIPPSKPAHNAQHIIHAINTFSPFPPSPTLIPSHNPITITAKVPLHHQQHLAETKPAKSSIKPTNPPPLSRPAPS
ncbi:hypothetical protein BDR22DRAFT_531241 [Usnea florida]